jgi:tight adherence protein B
MYNTPTFAFTAPAFISNPALTSPLTLLVISVMAGFCGYIVLQPASHALARYEARLQRSLGTFHDNRKPRDIVLQQFLLGGGAFTVIYLITGFVPLALFVGAMACYVPYYSLKKAHHKRVRIIESQFVDTLSILSTCLRANQTLSQTVEIVARRAASPTREEFRTVAEELRFGMTPEQAFERMAARLGVPCVDSLANAISVTRMTGGDLAVIFDRLSESIRESSRLEALVEAMTAQGRLQGNILGLLPVFLALVIYIIEPQMITPLFTTIPGYVILVIILACELTGLYLIRKAMQIPV